MSDLCANINALLSLHAAVTTQLQSDHHPSADEADALLRLKNSGILVPKKRPRAKKGETQSKAKKAKTGTSETDKDPTSQRSEPELDEIADQRIDHILPEKLPPAITPQELIELLLRKHVVTTLGAEDDFLRDLLCGFASPEEGWASFLTNSGLHSDQKVTTETVTTAAAAKVPGQVIPLIDSESNILSLIKTNSATSYANERILLCEMVVTQQAWMKLEIPAKTIHNRDLFVAQNPKLFNADQTPENKREMANTTHKDVLDQFLRQEQNPLVLARNRVSNLAQVFGLAAIIHPAASFHLFSQKAVTLTRVCKRLHLALIQRPELRREIQARADMNLNVLREFVAGMVVAEQKDSVRKYFTDLTTRVPLYNY
ncbi:hypothetical protein B0H16DRAFT_1570151 [Mycena metata]|uniref:Uncharacterized protein n=1 Tax=Mycena metata TaxID=1033252 RepID=A0AAD7IC62_9AGAR|nr:hypothetical protein B0H16DRAFT_1570151 [Mycena metata]